MSIMQVLLSREGLSPDGSVEVSEDTLAVIESSDVEADAVESDIEAVTEANEEAAEVEEAVEDVGEAVTALESIMERIAAATADGSKLTQREIGFISNEAHAVYRALGIQNIPVLATESIDANNNAVLALEGIADVAKRLLEGFKNSMQRIGAALSKFWTNVFTAYGRIRVRATKLKAKLEALTGDTGGEFTASKAFEGFEKLGGKFLSASKTILVDYQGALFNFIKKGCEGDAPSLQAAKSSLKGLPHQPSVIRVMNKYDLFEYDKDAESEGQIKVAGKAALIKAMDDVIALCDLVQRSRAGWAKINTTIEELLAKFIKAAAQVSFGGKDWAIGFAGPGETVHITKKMAAIRTIVGAALRAPRDFIDYELSVVNRSLNLTARAIKAASAA